MKAVFLTYNSVGRNLANGWVKKDGCNILLAQGFIRKDRSGLDLSEKRQTIVRLWREICCRIDLREIDFFAIYCGKIPEMVANLACGLDPRKIIFLHCGCCWNPKYPYNDLVINNSGWITTSCGGIEEMLVLFESTIKQKNIPICNQTLGYVLENSELL